MPDHDHSHSHDHDHDHPHGAGGAATDKDPAEQEALARDLAGELADLFARYVTGGIDFAELSFATYDVLQDLHVVATGAYELVADDTSDDSGDDEEAEGDEAEANGGGDEDGGIDDGYDEGAATEEQEDLSGEPAR